MLKKLWNMFLSTPPRWVAFVCFYGVMANVSFGGIILIAGVVGIWGHGRHVRAELRRYAKHPEFFYCPNNKEKAQ